MRHLIALLSALVLAGAAAPAAQADISPKAAYMYDSLRGLTGQAPDNDIGRWIVNTQNLFGIDIYDWHVQAWTRVNDHHLHALIYFDWRRGTTRGTMEQTFHGYVNWPHDPSLRSYHDGASH